MNLSNQALIQELQKRIKEGTIEAKVIPDKVKENSTSLLSYLGSKELLFLIGLTTAAALLFGYFMKVTTSQVTSYDLNFDDPPNTIKTAT
jgi:hypothetical protein